MPSYYYASRAPISTGDLLRNWQFAQQCAQAITEIRKLLLEGVPQLGVFDQGGNVVSLNPTVAIEVVFEHVREKEFPERQSRWQAIHLCETEADVVEFSLKYQPRRNYIYEVSCESEEDLFRADQILLNAGLSDSGDPVTEVEQMKERARRYWSGQFSGNPLVEVLAPGGSVNVTKLVRILDRRLAPPVGQALLRWTQA